MLKPLIILQRKLFMRQLLILICLVINTNELLSQKINHTSSYRFIDNDAYFRFSYDNDFFTSSDYNYTQGYSFEWVNKRLEKNPLNYILLSIKNSQKQFGLVLEHNGYTPKNLREEDIILSDRPYASAIMLKSFKTAIDSISKQRLSSSFSLGVIGPAAFGKEMQVGIHNATKNIIPQGWHNQIKNDLVINYQLSYEKKITGIKDNVLLNGNAEINLGSLNTSTSIGAVFMVGLFETPFKTNNSGNFFQVYFYFHPLVNYHLHDATLQSGLLNNRSPYTISQDRIKNVVFQLNSGIVIQTKKVFFEYFRSNTTKRFDTGISPKWGGIKFGVKF